MPLQYESEPVVEPGSATINWATIHWSVVLGCTALILLLLAVLASVMWQGRGRPLRQSDVAPHRPEIMYQKLVQQEAGPCRDSY